MDNNQHSPKRDRETLENVANLWNVPKIGQRNKCRFYKPDSYDNYNKTMVFNISFDSAKSAKNEKEAACYFGSALCVLCPDLTSFVMDILEEDGIELSVIRLPSKAGEFGVKLDNIVQYNTKEIYSALLIGDNFMSKTIPANAKKLGIHDDKIQAHAKAEYNVFRTSNKKLGRSWCGCLRGRKR